MTNVGIDKILLPLNPSQNLENAQAYTLWLADALEAQIIPLYVVPEPDEVVGMGEVTEVAAVDEALKSIGANKLRSFDREAGKVQHDAGLLRRGNLVDTILDVAKEEQVSLIVLPGFSSRLSRTVLGSEVARVVEYSEASVLVVREEHEVPRRRQRLMVPFSGHIPRINACNRVLELAQELNLSVSFVSVTRHADETANLLEQIRKDWHAESPQLDVDIAIDVKEARWPMGGQRRLLSYGVQEDDIALVVLPRVHQGDPGDVTTDLLRLFTNQSKVPVLILK